MKKAAQPSLWGLLIPFLLGGIAFGAEVGYWELSKRKLQNAVDTAAHAAGTQVRAGIRDTQDLKDAAYRVASVSGFDDGDAAMSLTYPPASGPYAGDNSAVHVKLDHTIDRKFSGIFEDAPVAFSVESTVLISNGRPACVLALAPQESRAVDISGSTDITLDGCDVASNSVATDAIYMHGSADLETDCLSAVGGVSTTSGLVLNDCPAPIEYGPRTPDPYADRPEPTWSSCEAGSKFTQSSGNSPARPSPGCYRNGANVNKRVELDPGVYIFDGGTWKFNAQAEVSGSGVTIFLTNGAEIDINGSADFNISAPTSGDYSGLAIYVDRDDASSHKINGGSGFSVAGAIYSASGHIDFTGNTTGSGPGICTQVIGYTVEFTGDSGFSSDCANSGTEEIKTAQSIQIVE